MIVSPSAAVQRRLGSNCSACGCPDDDASWPRKQLKSAKGNISGTSHCSELRIYANHGESVNSIIILATRPIVIYSMSTRTDRQRQVWRPSVPKSDRTNPVLERSFVGVPRYWSLPEACIVYDIGFSLQGRRARIHLEFATAPATSAVSAAAWRA